MCTTRGSVDLEREHGRPQPAIRQPSTERRCNGGSFSSPPSAARVALCASVSFTEHIIDDDALGGYNLDALDLDGDGDVDVLAASYHDDTVAWHENDGAQSFARRVITDAAATPQALCGADLDGDGDVDAVAGDIGGNGELNYYENDGSMSFTEHSISVPARGAVGHRARLAYEAVVAAAQGAAYVGFGLRLLERLDRMTGEPRCVDQFRGRVRRLPLRGRGEPRRRGLRRAVGDAPADAAHGLASSAVAQRVGASPSRPDVV
ncbi:hypothetical protein JL720_15689 [Aureococcus anophagefferens]|nr:hypothetical protein JL720_15689 [Aureococcus anophagefferens]